MTKTQGWAIIGLLTLMLAGMTGGAFWVQNVYSEQQTLADIKGAVDAQIDEARSGTTPVSYAAAGSACASFCYDNWDQADYQTACINDCNAALMSYPAH